MSEKKRFGKEDWITLGFGQLVKEGIGGLTLDALCQTASRTKGSFYHHFKDHEAFLTALAHAWKKQNTLDVAEETLASAPEDQARTLALKAAQLDHDLDRAMRQFAQLNQTARQTVREVDDLRTQFIVQLYLAQGLDEATANSIAKIEYAAFVGAQIIWPEMTAEERLKLDHQFADLVSRGTIQPQK